MRHRCRRMWRRARLRNVSSWTRVWLDGAKPLRQKDSVMLRSADCPRRRELPEDVLKNSSVLVVENLLRRVDANPRLEVARRRARWRHANGDVAAAREVAGEHLRKPDDVVRLLAGETERLASVARRKLERNDPHADEIRSVDPLVALDRKSTRLNSSH